jgi:hypothetical protein
MKQALGSTPETQNSPSYDVVISYAGEDRERAVALVGALQQQNIHVFYDQQAIDRLAGESLPEKLRDIYENQGRYCILLLSEHYKQKLWTMQELKAAADRLARTPAYLIPILLDESQVPKELSNIAYLQWKTHDADKITDVLLKKLNRAYRWHELTIRTSNDDTEVTWKSTFTDIAWIGNEGWLSIAISVGGAGGSVGQGALLHTSDGGVSWRKIDTHTFPSSAGQFTWGPQGTYLYNWNEIGPISSVAVYKRLGVSSPELWIASATGIYSSQNGGASWFRSTPGPDHAKRYALFSNLANVEGFSEVYAVGWQGIAHWSRATNEWDLQLPTYTHMISSICVLGGSENRNVWAVGRAGVDEDGNWGSDSHGAIYYLEHPRFKEWQQADLNEIKFNRAQALSDIIMLDLENVIAVGQQGLVIRGHRHKGSWEWTRSATPIKDDLYSISFSAGTLWVVGDQGVILRSTDRGATWTLELVKQDSQGNRPVLRRVRFWGDNGWILGDGVIMRSIRI